MELEQIDAVWLEKQGDISVAGLCELSGLSERDLLDLVDYGALQPINPDDAQPMFAGHYVRTVRIASRLRHDFELDSQSLALALSLVERIHQLETELRQVRVLIPHRSS
ncbi:MAG: chaperone modulator CbpM [Betaproteobacteria bacterium]